MKECVLRILVLFSSLHYVVSQIIPSAYLPYELVQWANGIGSLIKTGFVKPQAYTFGDAQCVLSKSQHDYVLEKNFPKLHNIWNDLKAKYEIDFKEPGSVADVEDSDKMIIDNKMNDVWQAFEGLMERIPADGSLDKEDLCSYALSQLTDDALRKTIDSMRSEIINQTESSAFSSIVAGLNASAGWCNSTYTASGFIYSIHSELMSMEVGGYITMLFSYWYLSKYNGQGGCTYPFLETPDQMVTELHDDFKQIMIKYAEKFYSAMIGMSDRQWSCFPEEPYRAADAEGRCEDIDMHGVDWTKYCDPFPDNYHCLAIKRPCLGHIWRCESRDPSEVCMDNFESSRRYQWIAFETDTLPMTCPRENLRRMSWKGRQNCACLCVDNEPDSMSIHIFNLQPVEADVNENKVVTGVRVIIDHEIVHLQIKQGILGRDWRVKGSAWKEINDISEEIYAHRIGKDLHGEKPEVTKNLDYYVVSYSQRFDIDELRVPTNHVLTGVKFHTGTNGRLKIAILTREFNPVTGKLKVSNGANIVTGRKLRRWNHYSGWYPFDNIDRSEYHGIAGKDYLVFTESWWTYGDSGQTTVPFFDPRIVESKPATAMGGFGFAWRSGIENGFPLLSPVLFSLDYKTYIKDSLDRLRE